MDYRIHGLIIMCLDIIMVLALSKRIKKEPSITTRKGIHVGIVLIGIIAIGVFV